MSFEIIENLSSKELAALYDDVIEGATNIAQCFCGTDGICKRDVNDWRPAFCMAARLNGGAAYMSSEQCRTYCRQECQTENSDWWVYVQSSCNDYTEDHRPCYRLTNDNWNIFCR